VKTSTTGEVKGTQQAMKIRPQQVGKLFPNSWRPQQVGKYFVQVGGISPQKLGETCLQQVGEIRPYLGGGNTSNQDREIHLHHVDGLHTHYTIYV